MTTARRCWREPPARPGAGATTEAIPLSSGSVDTVLCGPALGHLPGAADDGRDQRR
ncbi:MAG: hypothetical protein U0521_02155 [Anaerolineae bacterium]